MARIVNGPTLVDQGLHYSNVLLAETSTTPRLMLDDMINDDFINDGSRVNDFILQKQVVHHYS